MGAVDDPFASAQVGDRRLDMFVGFGLLRHHGVVDGVVGVLHERRSVSGIGAIVDGLLRLADGHRQMVGLSLSKRRARHKREGESERRSQAQNTSNHVFPPSV